MPPKREKFQLSPFKNNTPAFVRAKRDELNILRETPIRRMAARKREEVKPNNDNDLIKVVPLKQNERTPLHKGTPLVRKRVREIDESDSEREDGEEGYEGYQSSIEGSPLRKIQISLRKSSPDNTRVESPVSPASTVKPLPGGRYYEMVETPMRQNGIVDSAPFLKPHESEDEKAWTTDPNEVDSPSRSASPTKLITPEPREQKQLVTPQDTESKDQEGSDDSVVLEEELTPTNNGDKTTEDSAASPVKAPRRETAASPVEAPVKESSFERVQELVTVDEIVTIEESLLEKHAPGPEPEQGLEPVEKPMQEPSDPKPEQEPIPIPEASPVRDQDRFHAKNWSPHSPLDLSRSFLSSSPRSIFNRDPPKRDEEWDKQRWGKLISYVQSYRVPKDIHLVDQLDPLMVHREFQCSLDDLKLRIGCVMSLLEKRHRKRRRL